ncbi:hypothetical protein [Streptomyces sp. NPDC005374]|uniref:hypothetical protein n=1 Tax=Streptomyces sp. NPDC005374 TaxID=3364713 RepID=UPI00367E814D
MGTGRPPVQVHTGNCHMAGKRRRPIRPQRSPPPPGRRPGSLHPLPPGHPAPHHRLSHPRRAGTPGGERGRLLTVAPPQPRSYV